MTSQTTNNLSFQCEMTTSQQPHKEPFYYCTKCNITICTRCLIEHIIKITHTDPSEIVDVETGVTTYKSKLIQLKSQLQETFTSVSTSKENNSSIDKLNVFINEISLKQSNVSANVIDVLEIVKRFYTVVEKVIKEPKINSQVIESCRNEFIIYVNECNEIESKMNSKANGGDVFKQFNEFQNKAETFIKNTLNLLEVNNNNTKETLPIKEVLDLINETDIIKVINEFTHKVDSFKEKLNQLLQDKVKNITGDDILDGVNNSNHNNIINNNSINNQNNIHSDSSSTSSTSMTHSPSKSPSLSESNLKQKPIQKQSLLKTTSSLQNNNSNISLVITLRHGDAVNPGNIKIYDPKSKKIAEQTLTHSQFNNPSNKITFPFKNSKYTNIGNNCIVITGGVFGDSSTNKAFLLSILNYFPLQTQISDLLPMLENRHSHNSLYLPKYNQLLICSGVLLRSSEYIDLNNHKNKWVSLPQLQRIRSNATIFCINESNVCCVGGYDHQENKYQHGFEVLNMNNVSNGWKEIVYKEMFAISTMGVINKGKGRLMFVGGFQGGKKYLMNGVEVIMKNDDSFEVERVEMKEGLFNRGVIFYSSQEFVKCGDNKYVNFDFRQVLYEFDTSNMKMNVIEA